MWKENTKAVEDLCEINLAEGRSFRIQVLI